MSSRILVSTLALGLVLAGPVAAEGPQSAKGQPAASIDINALTAESDFTVFMAKNVPEDVRRVALRRLWTLLQLPVSCHDLCYEPESAAPGLAQVASEQRAVPLQ